MGHVLPGITKIGLIVRILKNRDKIVKIYKLCPSMQIHYLLGFILQFSQKKIKNNMYGFYLFIKV